MCTCVHIILPNSIIKDRRQKMLKTIIANMLFSIVWAAQIMCLSW